MKPKFILFLLFLVIIQDIYSQKLYRTIVWNDVEKYNLQSPEQGLLTFNNANYTAQKLPLYQEIIKNNIQSVTITNCKYQELSINELKYLQNVDLIKDSITVDNFIGIQRKEKNLIYSFVPLRKNRNTGKIEKIINFEIVYNGNSELKTNSKPKSNHLSNSVLSKGDWYKIAITENGIYKIDYDFLKNLGLNPDIVNPRNIKIYGNGGQMLSESNSDPRYDDLIQNPIYIKGEDDGIFNKNDYILFYAQGPSSWSFDYNTKQFSHQLNLYEKQAYYFITINTDLSNRIQTQTSSALTVTDTISTFTDLHYWENERVNLLTSGKLWVGESFEVTNPHDSLFTIPDMVDGEKGYIYVETVARSSVSSNFSVSINSNFALNVSVPQTILGDNTSNYANINGGSSIFTQSGSNLLLAIKYNPPKSSSLGWLNKVDINVIRKLVLRDSILQFRNTNTIGAGKISKFSIANVDSNTLIWDITKPLNPFIQNTIYSNHNLSYIIPTDSLHEFFLTKNKFFTPINLGKVSNQNLHALGGKSVDMIIICHPDFMSEAERLKAYHETNDNLTTLLININDIYNEFSSGSQDISAIRDFVKLIYDKAPSANIPKYLLLFGIGSYNYTSKSLINRNYIPAYESDNSINKVQSYTSDDFYGYLDDNEGVWQPGSLIDIGIGRFPVSSLSEAKDIVDKTINYEAHYKFPDNLQNKKISNYADWKNSVCFVSDDEDSNTHFDQAESLSSIIKSGSKQLNINKIYLDAYKQYTTGGGPIYPEATTAFVNQVDNGTLLLNYSGHGGESGLATEKLLTIPEILLLNNKYNLPIFITATCEFSRYDNPAQISAGMQLLLNPDGGGIALLTTVRLAFSSYNLTINQIFLKYFLNALANPTIRLGDICRLTKSETGSTIYFRNFTLLGDPALRITSPINKIITTSINGKPTDTISITDTLKGLKKITINGYIQNSPKFNGFLYPTIYDKEQTILTLGNDPTSFIAPFQIQKSIIFKGKARVTNGNFSFSFIVPKDISSKYGLGKISYYAEDSINEANGVFNQIQVGGIDLNAKKDITPPDIKLYLDNENFISGNFTSNNPVLIAKLFDSSGINSVNSGVGHDIVAILDGQNQSPIILNNFYQADLDNYQKGKIVYNFSNLANGKHTLVLKAWDVYNNSREVSVDFYVIETGKLIIDKVFNYPNPFTSKTGFYFKHNQPQTTFDVSIQIYTVKGELIKTLHQIVSSDLTTINPIEWNGKDEYDEKIARGVYLYRIKIRSIGGESFETIQKLYIL